MMNYQREYEKLVEKINQELFARPQGIQNVSPEKAGEVIGRIMLANDLLNLVEESDTQYDVN